jgi:hypothetical protein
MLSHLYQYLPAADNLWLFTLNPKRAMVYAGAAFIAFAFVWYLLWLLPIHAWFRKPIEQADECPHCGSKDFRNSHIHTSMDRFRKKLGLMPFRCRGCTRRFISRSSGNARGELTSEALM